MKNLLIGFVFLVMGFVIGFGYIQHQHNVRSEVIFNYMNYIDDKCQEVIYTNGINGYELNYKYVDKNGKKHHTYSNLSKRSTKLLKYDFQQLKKDIED